MSRKGKIIKAESRLPSSEGWLLKGIMFGVGVMKMF